MPQVYTGFVGRYGGTSVDLDVLNNTRGVFSAHLIADRWPIYRSFFEWRFLFEHAETNVLSSTYTTGIFLKAMTILMPVGIYHILRNRRSPFTVLLIDRRCGYRRGGDHREHRGPRAGGNRPGTRRD